MASLFGMVREVRRMRECRVGCGLAALMGKEGGKGGKKQTGKWPELKEAGWWMT